MDSDSDWDSLSGGPDGFGEISVSIAADSTKQAKHTPRPPSGEKSQSTASKTPLQKTDQSDNRNVPRVAEQYRNRAKPQGVTVFQDLGDRHEETQKEILQPVKNTMHMSPERNSFHEIELKDNIRKNENFQISVDNNRKRSQLKDSNENLPYTEFEVSNASPREKIGDNEANPQPKNKLRQEYVTHSPVPLNVSQRNRKKDAKKKSDVSFSVKKPEKGKDTTNRGVLIVNENAGGYGSGDTEKDFSWNDDHDDVRNKKERALKNQLAVMHKSHQQNLLEERYLYDDGVRSYHSIYVDSDAKMPAIANKVETYTKRGVQEFFGTLQILIDFIVIFVIELLRFMLKQFGKKLIGGSVTAIGDFLIKPVFTALFNSIIQPVFILIWNIMYGFRRLLDPVIALSNEVLNQVAIVLGAIRLVQVNWQVNGRRIENV